MIKEKVVCLNATLIIIMLNLYSALFKLLYGHRRPHSLAQNRWYRSNDESSIHEFKFDNLV